MASLIGILAGQRLRAAMVLLQRGKPSKNYVKSVPYYSMQLSSYHDSSKFKFHSMPTTGCPVFPTTAGALHEGSTNGAEGRGSLPLSSMASPETNAAAARTPGSSSSLPSYFSCKKCLRKIAKEPVITICGHVFCWPCLYLSISRGVGLLHGKCPTCETSLDLFRPTKTVFPINDSGIHQYTIDKRFRPLPPRPSGRKKHLDHNFPCFVMKTTRNAMQVIGEASKGILSYCDSVTVKMDVITSKIVLQVVPRSRYMLENNTVLSNCWESFHSQETATTRNIIAPPSLVAREQQQLSIDNVTSLSTFSPLFPTSHVSFHTCCNAPNQPTGFHSSSIDDSMCKDKSAAEVHHNYTGVYRKGGNLSDPCKLQLQCEFHVNEWFSKIYFASKDYVTALVDVTDDVNRMLKRLALQLTQSHTPVCHESCSLKSYFYDTHTTSPLRRTTIWSSNTGSIPLHNDAQKELNITSLSPFAKWDAAPIHGWHAFASDFHQETKNEENCGINLLHAEHRTSYFLKNMKQDTLEMIVEIENLMDDFYLKMDELDRHVSNYRAFVESTIQDFLLALLEVWDWLEEPREPYILSKEEAYKQLTKLPEGWIEVIKRDLTHAVGPEYCKDDPSIINATSSLPIGCHVSLTTQPSSFLYCNACGKVEDNIEEPVVTYCGHLFCWRCLFDRVPSNPEPVSEDHEIVSCIVCESKVVSGCSNTGLVTVVPVFGKTKSIDDTCSANDMPNRHLAKKFSINVLNDNIEMLRFVAEEITLLGHMQTMVEENKRTFDSIKTETGMALEQLKFLITQLST